LARDVFQQFGGKTHSGKAVFSSRLATVVVAAASLAVAMRFQDILRTLGLASEVMAEGLFVPGMAMIYLKKKLPSAGLASLLAGGGFALLSFLGEWGLPAPGIPTWPYSVPYGLALSLAGFFIGAGIDMFKKADSGRSRNSCA
jgi:SSS family solute:Na+ symporter